MLNPAIESFVRDKADGVGHSGRTFYQHLRGTYDLLDGAPDYVRLAGLCHSIYGTNAFKRAVIPMSMVDMEHQVRTDFEQVQRRMNLPVTAWNKPGDNSNTAPDIGTRMSEVDRERTRAIILSGIDEGLKDHVKHMFEVWMKDDSEQPRRAVTGMHIARRAHRRATTQALEWNPPICEEKKP